MHQKGLKRKCKTQILTLVKNSGIKMDLCKFIFIGNGEIFIFSFYITDLKFREKIDSIELSTPTYGCDNSSTWAVECTSLLVVHKKEQQVGSPCLDAKMIVDGYR